MINSIPSNNANAIAPFAPLGRQAVGQESSDLKASTFKALEQAAGSARSENRRSPFNRPGDQADAQNLNGASSSVQAQDQKSQQESATKERLAKEQKQIAELAAVDREVHAHEQAHAAVGGPYAGTPTYEFVKGPDGVSYAVGGEVSISSAPIPNDPEATLHKAQQIREAANAPADPSPQDRRVAAAAASLEAQARAELHAKDAEQTQQAQQQSEAKTKAQKAEEEKRAEEEDARRADAKREQDRLARETELSQSSSARADIFAKSSQQTFDLTRKLVDIGAVKGFSSVGNFLNSRV